MNIRGKWLFVDGCPRSGTTLLNLLLNSHSDICISNELNIFKLREHVSRLFYKEAELLKVGERTRGPKETWTKEQVLSFTPSEFASGGEVIRCLYESTFNYPGEQVWFGDKLPGYYRYAIADFEELFDDFVVINTVRNPLLVLNSMMRRSKQARVGRDHWRKDQSIEDGLNSWIHAWNFVVENFKSDNFVCIKYEDLLVQPEKTLVDLSRKLAIGSDGFDMELINVEEEVIDSLSADDIRKVEAYLGGILDDWTLPVAELVARHGELSPLPLPFRDRIRGAVREILRVGYRVLDRVIVVPLRRI